MHDSLDGLDGLDGLFPVFSAAPQKIMAQTGSFTGYRPLMPLGGGYMSATSSSGHSFCGNAEGWGPLSPFRYDFTPCFIDVWVFAVAAFGVVCGSLALWWLLAKKPSNGLPKNWVFWTKQTLLGAVLADFVAQLVFQILSYRDIWFADFRVYTTVLTIASLAVVFAIQWIEHTRQRVANGVVLFYWLFLLIVLAVKQRSLVSQQTYVDNLPYFITYAVGFGLSTATFLVEWLGPRRHPGDYDVLVDDQEECPVEYADIFSRLTFTWMTPLMRFGYSTYLTEEDLWGLAHDDRTAETGRSFEEAWERELKKTTGPPSLWTALFRAYGAPYMLAAIFKIGNDLAAFAQPQLLRFLLAFVDSYHMSPEPQPVVQGAGIALSMFAVAVFQTIMIHQYFQLSFVSGMRIKGGLTSCIYRKALKLSNEGRASKTTGDIVNYMAVDVQRLQDLTQFGHQLWSAPFQMTICMVSLYQLVGWTMLAGIGVMLVMVPVNGYIARRMKMLQKQQMANKDKRSRLIAEIVNNMKSIKLYAWGTAFMNKLNYVRNDLELKNLRRIGANQAGANFTWNTTPFLVSCMTFTVFVMTHDEPLSTEIVFPALALFNLLSFPMSVLPMVITIIVEASVAVSRLTEFLVAEEIQTDAVIVKPAVEAGEEAVSIRDGSFSWNRHEDKAALSHIHFSADKGELTCVVGRVGAGKSSLLQSMLGDLWKIDGEVSVAGCVAYAAQQSWITNATVKENILFGHRYDSHFYEQTVAACALLDDFAQLPDGDETTVGERGISLSGGQKARVTLARAVYARADIYLLDDVLSAVDSHVGRHLIDNVLGPQGLLRSKTRILATNSIPVLMEAHSIYMLRDGEIVEKGTYGQLIAMKGLVSDLIKTAGQSESPTSASRSGSGSETSTVIEPEASLLRDDEIEEAQESLSALAAIKPGPSSSPPKKLRSASTTTLRRASAASFRGPRGKLTDEEASGNKTRQAKEHTEQGKVKWNVYLEYAKANNLFAVGVYLVALVAAQSASMGGSVWLKKWAEYNTDNGGNFHVGKYIGVYLAFGIGSALLVVTQMLILWIFCSIEASRKLHERMANAIFRSPMSFFDVTPAGRILNRFSSDIYRVDEVLARSFNMLFTNVSKSGFTLAVITVSTPWFALLVIPLSIMYIFVQRYYLHTSRELKRLDSVSKSPIYAHFQESLGGVSTIRAYRQQARFERENEWRMDANLRAFFPSISANRWLAVRLEFLGAVVILAAAGLSVVSVSRGSKLSAGMVGLAMSYALQIVTALNWIVRLSVEVETNIVSVERVLEYAALPSEAPDIIQRHRPPVSWPARGEVEFRHYSARYREGLDLVLKNINLDIRPREKIGVVGRTGAGKSSLTLALFRIIEPDTGHIRIDDLNTSSIGLLDLRRRLAIIPQDAALFEGTVRNNLDPAHVHDDTELWTVLEHARLKEHVSGMDGGLEAKLNEGGSNLSQGQRQLVSLARAMLTPSNILVLDEATAAVDVETDKMLQTTLRSAMFADKTIITVAHRINTILDSDRVVVLDKGEVTEFGTPQELIERRGQFYGLVKQAGLTE